MRKIFILFAVAFSTLFFTQEAGSVGKLLKNEASKTEIKADKPIVTERKPQSRKKENNSYGANYQWYQNYGNAEVFLRIPEAGYFTVEVGNQSISSSTGKFRFFDLSEGQIPISIYENGFLMYRTHLLVRDDMRLVLDFFINKGLYLLDSYPVQRKSYGFDEWSDVWNNPYAINTAVMSPRQFSDFLNAMKRNVDFDEERSRFIHQQLRTTRFTSEQIYHLLKQYSFDKNKLGMAKLLYTKCVDLNNFYIVYEAFDFDGSKRELSEYVSGR